MDSTTITRWSARKPGFNLSCRLKLDSSYPSTSYSTSMCNEWSLEPRIVCEMSDHTAGNLPSVPSSFPFLIHGLGQRCSYHNFVPRATPPSHTRTSTHPEDVLITGDRANTAFGVIFEKATSFSVSIISPIDSRILFMADHTASSAGVGSLNLLRKHLLRK